MLVWPSLIVNAQADATKTLSPMAGRPGGETKRIVFFTLPPVREIDLVGAVDVFSSANRAVGGKPLYDIKIVNVEKARADRKITGIPHKAWMRSPTVAVLAAPMFLPALSLVFCSRRRANFATGSIPRGSENSMA